MEVSLWVGVSRWVAGCMLVGKQKECKLLSKIEKGINNLAKTPNKRVWCVLVKGL